MQLQNISPEIKQIYQLVHEAHTGSAEYSTLSSSIHSFSVWVEVQFWADMTHLENLIARQSVKSADQRIVWFLLSSRNKTSIHH